MFPHFHLHSCEMTQGAIEVSNLDVRSLTCDFIPVVTRRSSLKARSGIAAH